MDKRLIIGLVFCLLIPQVQATPILSCLNDVQEQTIATIAANSNASSDQLKSVFMILCENKQKSDNVYTRNETDQKLNFTETILGMQLKNIESVNESLRSEMNSRMDNLSSSLRENLDILKAIETMTIVVNTSVSQEKWQGEIRSLRDKIDGYQSIIDDTRSQLNLLITQGVQAQNTSYSQPVQQVQQRPVDYTMAIILIALIFCGMLSWYIYATKFYRRESRPVTENISMSDDEFDDALDRTGVIGDSRMKSSRARSSRDAKMDRIRKTVRGIKDETKEFEEKRK